MLFGFVRIVVGVAVLAGCAAPDLNDIRSVPEVLMQSEALHGEHITVGGFLTLEETDLLCPASLPSPPAFDLQQCIRLGYSLNRPDVEDIKMNTKALASRWVIIAGEYAHTLCFKEGPACVWQWVGATQAEQQKARLDKPGQLLKIFSVRAATQAERRALEARR